MIALLLLIIALAAGAGYYWYTQQQKLKGESGNIYRANIKDDCTFGTGDFKNIAPKKGTIDIQIKTANLASVVATAAIPSQDGKTDYRSSIVAKTGCVRYSVDEDKITYNIKKSDLSKWIGLSELKENEQPPEIIFKRTDDKIRATEPVSGSTCVFTKVLDEKIDSVCEKPSIGCQMM